MNTIIINKIMMHMLDFEHRKIYLSEDFCELNDTTQEYYHKKVEKALYSPAIKELVVPSLHELLLRADKMLEDDEEFKKQAKEISEKFFALGSVIEEMPNSNILYVDCYRDGVHMIAALKLNYKYNSVSLVEEENVRITRRQVLPQIGTAVDEAIIIDTDHKKISLIEKKYLIDGKMDTYLNSQWIKGETSGHFQYVKSLAIDCDKDTLLAKVEQIGAACHTGNRSCFYTTIVGADYDAKNPLQIFESVYNMILDRKEHPKEGSYTNYLFDKGLDKILKKVGEEATEVVIAAKNPNPEEVKYELSDFLYHAMVLMAEKGITWDDITKELADR